MGRIGYVLRRLSGSTPYLSPPDRIGERQGERGRVGEGRDGGFFVNVCIVRKYFITFGQNSRESLSI